MQYHKDGAIINMKYIIILLSLLLSSCASNRNRKLNEEIFAKYPSIPVMSYDTEHCSTIPFMIRVNGIWTTVHAHK